MSAAMGPGEFDVSGKKVMLDEDSFMQNPEVWDEHVAEWMAKNLEGIEKLSEEHWKVLKYLRNYWETYGACPPIRMLTKSTGTNLERMYELFPDGPAHGACKVAGAPKPTGCV